MITVQTLRSYGLYASSLLALAACAGTPTTPETTPTAGQPPATEPAVAPGDVTAQEPKPQEPRPQPPQGQERDVQAIARIQGARLERAHLTVWAARLGVTDLLERVIGPSLPDPA